MFQRSRLIILFVALIAMLIPVSIVTAQGPKPGTRAPKILAGTAFTYQGQLKKNGASINDTCNFQFNLWADAAGTVAAGASPQTLNGVIVKNGLFTVQIDFGAGAFTGDARWMGTAVQCTNDPVFTPFLTLAQINPVPMASSLPGLYTQVIGGSTIITTTGNVGINTTAPAAALDVNGTLRAIKNSSNDLIVATTGGTNAWAKLDMATISQTWSLGTSTNYNGNQITLYDETFKQARMAIQPNGGDILFNGNNTVSGGSGNTASGGVGYNTVSGGQNNTANSNLFGYNTIGGGYSNFALAELSTVSGGDSNTASGNRATVPGGFHNTALGNTSFAAGSNAQALHNGTFVWNCDNCNSFASTAPSQFLINALGGVGINTNSPAGSLNVYGTSWFQGDTTPLPPSAGKGLALGFNNFFDSGYLFAYDYGTNTPKTLTLNGPGGTVGIGVAAPARTLDVNGTLRIRNLSNGLSSQTLCFTNAGDITACSSSIRYKTNIANLNLGLDAIAQLRPVTYNWKADGQPDLGFVAEEVNQVTPLLTFLNKDGQIEGVKYDRISAILVKGMQEQQQQISDLKAQNALLEARVTALEKNSPVSNNGVNVTFDLNGFMLAGLLIGAVMMYRARK